MNKKSKGRKRLKSLPKNKIKFKEIKKALKEIEFTTLRSDSDELFEVVLVKGALEQLTGCLKKFFGEPVFPSEKKYPFDPQRLVKDYGGILPGQTLYCHKEGLIYAMLWPWQDGESITFKLIQKP